MRSHRRTLGTTASAERGQTRGLLTVYRRAVLNRQLLARERRAMDGRDRAWVHALLLSWQRHYAKFNGRLGKEVFKAERQIQRGQVVPWQTVKRHHGM